MKLIIIFSALLISACTLHKQAPTSQAIACLDNLAANDNFAAVPASLYTGVKDPIEHARLNAHFQKSANLLANAIRNHSDHKTLLTIFGNQINQIDREQLETEDAAQLALTFEKALDCMGFDSSEGILNRWMYGDEIMKLIS